jgi:hypothetical protein
MEKQNRENGMKELDTDLTNPKNLEKGFIMMF